MITFEMKNENGEVILIYLVSDYHRKLGNPNKSIWRVSPKDEYDCFRYTYSQQWVLDNNAWGFLQDENKNIVIIGVGVNGESLQIARFKREPNAEQWHGYPCNYMANTYDIPHTAILKNWVERKTITKAKMIKIQHGYACNL